MYMYLLQRRYRHPRYHHIVDLSIYFALRNMDLLLWFQPFKKKKKKGQKYKHTAASIRWSSPTQLLISRSEAYLWLSGREAEFSTVCGRMWKRGS